jgi:hypothetical protein
MGLSAAHEVALSELIEAVRSEFPAGSVIQAEPTQGLNLRVTVAGNSRAANADCRPVSIRFSGQALNAFLDHDSHTKARALQAVRQTVRARLVYYESVTRRDNAFIIDVGNEMRDPDAEACRRQG